MTNRPLTEHDVRNLAALGDAVLHGQPITRLSPDGDVTTKIARAFAHDGGGFLTAKDDIRDGFVWVSGLTEEWWPVAELIEGMDQGTVALNYRP